MKKLFLAILLAAILLLKSCADKPAVVSQAAIPVVESLKALNSSFEKRIEKIDRDIYVAIGYGLANSIMIEGKDSLIIIDCMESMESAKEVVNDFRKISSKPVKAIIYTHHHTDHVFGARAFAENNFPDVYAHELFNKYFDQNAALVRNIVEQRAFRMFGVYLNEEELVNCGIGPHLHFKEGATLGAIRPNKTFKDSLALNIAGINMVLFHAPGETPDQLFVWLPERKILFCGDNLYKTFPNLYTIRGTPYRDINLWKNSLDKMRYLSPEIIIPSHTEPIFGSDSILKILTDYRDAIQFVHDQTVRYMNAGFSPDEIAEKVVLPAHLQQSPWLQEFYGKVSWSVRSVYDGYLGFFDGNPTNLLPMTKTERAKKMETLAGGKEALSEQIQKAMQQEEYQWALELTDIFLALYADEKNMVAIRVEALQRLGVQQSNPNARHYYLAYAKELQGLNKKNQVQPSAEMVHEIPLATIFNGMAARLNVEKSINTQQVVVFDFFDTGEKWTVIIRNGVAEVQPFELKQADLTVKVKATVWKELAAKLRGPVKTYLKGEVKVDGGQIAFISFLKLFDIEE